MYEKQQAPVPLLPCFIPISVILSVCFPLNVECGCSRSPVIFNMGDSNSDTGGFYSGLGIIMPPPEGRAFFHKFAGRLSDGRLIIDFLCELFTFTSLPFSCFFVFLGITKFRVRPTLHFSADDVGLWAGPSQLVRPAELIESTPSTKPNKTPTDI
ncbi:GDSL esterase/lipase [Vitis vinifera]|uniref:GDSL esterase/lipase n=1 Tax=Vitis vinifera TaxID=29760 RepID=A0A438E1S2_VITVI|nr:GDSL esterase/lipase [Vitis vinifera]